MRTYAHVPGGAAVCFADVLPQTCVRKRQSWKPREISLARVTLPE